MNKVNIYGTNLQVSKFSFGTANLHHLLFAKERNKLLEVAFKHGFTHFDTSPYYGNGIAEKQLGMLGKEVRQNITVATKVGIYPSNLFGICKNPYLIKLAEKLSFRKIKPFVNYNVSNSEKSIYNSLRVLKRDALDIVFIHEPIYNLIEYEEYKSFFDRMRTKGIVKYWGLAGELDKIVNFLESYSDLNIITQCNDNLKCEHKEILLNLGREMQFSYGYFRNNNQNLNHTKIIHKAMKCNVNGSILYSTRKLERIINTVNIIEKYENTQ